MFDNKILEAIACTNGVDIHDVYVPEYIDEYLDVSALFTEEELRTLETLNI